MRQELAAEVFGTICIPRSMRTQYLVVLGSFLFMVEQFPVDDDVCDLAELYE